MRAVRKRPIEMGAVPIRVSVVVGVTDVISTRPWECEATVSTPRIGDRKNVVIDYGRSSAMSPFCVPLDSLPPPSTFGSGPLT